MSDNKRIVKNTLLLYLRMLITMTVSLYTSRVVLSALGVVDYGLYNVVGSVVAMFVFLRSSMGNATHRYIAFALGKNDEESLKTTFATCVIVHFILAAIIVILSESVGLWLLYNKMEIPQGRTVAAFWALQFSIATCALGIICVPFDAEIIAHEKMGAFAFMSILDVTFKLVVAFIIVKVRYDKLIIYAALLFCIQLINRFIYGTYCKVKFPETHVSLRWNGSKISEMFKFAGWNIVGNMAAIGCTPAINIFLNMFFGPAVNAARGLAVQVQGAVKAFITNFQLAVIPQITKSYAKGDMSRMHDLIITSSKFSYFLFFCLALPIMLETRQLLSIWLVDVPDHAVEFLRLVLLVMLVESWEQPLHTANLATGKLKKFQTVKGFTLLSMLPIIYILLKMGVEAEMVFVVQLGVTFLALILQLLMMRSLIQLPVKRYINEVFGRALIVTVLSSILPIYLCKVLPDTVVMMFVICVFSVLNVLLVTYLMGLNGIEKSMVNNKIRAIVNNK